jgi:hypothetical protein
MAAPSPSAFPLNANGTPQLRHVFVIILENQAEDNTFGSKMPVPYLQNTVIAQGAFVPNYFGTSHFSLGNYLSLVSGQSVTTLNQQDCPNYTPIVQTSTGAYSQVGGMGCVYPAATMTVADQLTAAGFTYKGYMEDMGNDTTRENATCGQTVGGLGTPDATQMAQSGSTPGKPKDQYAMRHNPFAYFLSDINSGTCAKNVLPLGMNTLGKDLASIATTANYTFITPNLCNDGHDVPCVAPGQAMNTASDFSNENAFLAFWVPMITRSPAFKQDGLLLITFDESAAAHNGNVGTDTANDGSSCCNETNEIDPNTATPGQPGPPLGAAVTYVNGSGNGTPGNSGGGRTGTILVSPFIKPGTMTATNYNHYGALRSVEDEFGFAHLGFAADPMIAPFGTDIFGTMPTRYTIAL